MIKGFCSRLIFQISKYGKNYVAFIFILLLFFFLVVSLSCISKEQYSLKEPNALSDNRIRDFGQVEEGEVLEHIFVLRNYRDKPLTITNMHTSCGCTASEAQKKLILPGEYTQIKVKFHTQGYSGLVNQYVYVHTDDLLEPVIKYSLKAEVVR